MQLFEAVSARGKLVWDIGKLVAARTGTISPERHKIAIAGEHVGLLARCDDGQCVDVKLGTMHGEFVEDSVRRRRVRLSGRSWEPSMVGYIA